MARPPIINDISTDLDDPPVFQKAPGKKYDPRIPRSFRKAIEEHYAHLAPLRLEGSAADHYAKALEHARAIGRKCSD